MNQLSLLLSQGATELNLTWRSILMEDRESATGIDYQTRLKVFALSLSLSIARIPIYTLV